MVAVLLFDKEIKASEKLISWEKIAIKAKLTLSKDPC